MIAPDTARARRWTRAFIDRRRGRPGSWMAVSSLCHAVARRWIMRPVSCRSVARCRAGLGDPSWAAGGRFGLVAERVGDRLTPSAAPGSGWARPRRPRPRLRTPGVSTRDPPCRPRRSRRRAPSSFRAARRGRR